MGRTWTIGTILIYQFSLLTSQKLITPDAIFDFSQKPCKPLPLLTFKRVFLVPALTLSYPLNLDGIRVFRGCSYLFLIVFASAHWCTCPVVKNEDFLVREKGDFRSDRLTIADRFFYRSDVLLGNVLALLVPLRYNALWGMGGRELEVLPVATHQKGTAKRSRDLGGIPEGAKWPRICSQIFLTVSPIDQPVTQKLEDEVLI